MNETRETTFFNLRQQTLDRLEGYLDIAVVLGKYCATIGGVFVAAELTKGNGLSVPEAFAAGAAIISPVVMRGAQLLVDHTLNSHSS